MRIKLAVPDQLDDHERKNALNAALEAVTIADEGLITRGIVPPAAAVIKAGKVKWKPEPPGDEHFDLATTVIGRGWGDCDDLAPWHAASLRASGRDPRARAIVRKSGPERWHALVRRGDGSIEDPSRAAGMGSRVSGYEDPLAPIVLPMADERRMAIALAPGVYGSHHVVGGQGQQWFARLDVPSTREPWAWTSMAAHPNPQTALAGCIRGARIIGEDDIDGEDEARLAVVHDLIMGADPYEVAEALQEVAGDDVDVMRVMIDGQNVGNFFRSLSRAVKSVARPIARVATSALPALIPAAGLALTPFTGPLGPLAAAGLSAAMRGGGGGGRPAPAPMRPPGAPPPGFQFFGGQRPQPQQQGYGMPQQHCPPCAPPSWGMQPGQPFSPWGTGHPAFMRF